MKTMPVFLQITAFCSGNLKFSQILIVFSSMLRASSSEIASIWIFDFEVQVDFSRWLKNDRLKADLSMLRIASLSPSIQIYRLDQTVSMQLKMTQPNLNNPSCQELNSQVQPALMPSISNFEDEQAVQEEEIEVVNTRDKKSKVDQAQIIRLYNEQIQREAVEKKLIEERKIARRAKSTLAEVPLNKQTSSVIEEDGKQLRAGRIRQKIERLSREYKTMYRPSSFESKLQVFRYECKERVFFYCTFGLEELRELNSVELSLSEEQLLKKCTHQQDIFAHCKRLALQIDIEMLKKLNKSSRVEMGREYKEQWESFLTFLKEETNFQLRRKLLTRDLPPKRIPIANQLQFMTTAKREEIIEKDKRYIAQFSVEKPIAATVEQEVINRQRIESFQIKKDQKVIRGNKYLEQNTITVLEQLMSEAHLTTMKNRLSTDLSGKSKQNLLENFFVVFTM